MTKSSAIPIRQSRPDRVIIIGGGLAGLFTALKLAPLPVTILTPRPLGEGASSAWAQGGIAAALGDGDTPASHAADTIAAGAGLADPGIARLIASEAPERIDDLLRYGVPFDRDLEGKLRLSREAAHSARRIVRVNGDRAGSAVMAALIGAASSTPSISVLENTVAAELAVLEGGIVGVYARRVGQSERAFFLPGRAVVLATGGLGQVFRVTTNPKEASGNGLAMAARAGAVIADPEFVQFHPTAFDIGKDPAPLASEAIRGEGAVLVNANRERFMLDAHPDAELAPRDIVARAVYREIAEGRGAFLDCRALDLAKAFPTAYSICMEAGLDPACEPIPVAPAAHYHMGGVFTDARGRTTLSRLWACGEVACTGVHGANRLASNSLLEALVFGARVAQDIGSEASQWYAMGGLKGVPDSIDLPMEEQRATDAYRRRLREAMTAGTGVERSESSLKSALASLKALERKVCSAEIKSMITAAMFVTAAALERRESRGAHLRLDYPNPAQQPIHTFIDMARMNEIVAKAILVEGSHATGIDAARKQAANE